MKQLALGSPWLAAGWTPGLPVGAAGTRDRNQGSPPAGVTVAIAQPKMGPGFLGWPHSEVAQVLAAPGPPRRAGQRSTSFSPSSRSWELPVEGATHTHLPRFSLLCSAPSVFPQPFRSWEPHPHPTRGLSLCPCLLPGCLCARVCSQDARRCPRVQPHLHPGERGLWGGCPDGPHGVSGHISGSEGSLRPWPSGAGKEQEGPASQWEQTQSL